MIYSSLRKPLMAGSFEPADRLSGVTDAKMYFDAVLKYMEADGVRQFPNGNRYLWYINESAKICDAMCQSQMAQVYHALAMSFDSGDARRNTYLEASQLAANSFDWTSANGGVAHNFDDDTYWYVGAHVGEESPRFALNVHNRGIRRLYSLHEVTDGDFKTSLRTRIERGLNALLDETVFTYIENHSIPVYGTRKHWSYHRLWQTGGGKVLDNYHDDNYTTTKSIGEIAAKFGYGSRARLLDAYAALWEWSYHNYSI